MAKITQLKERLRKALECPVCSDTMERTTVRMCPNGHAFCNECRAKMQRCPICRNPNIDGRCIILEDIANFIDSPPPPVNVSCQTSMSGSLQIGCSGEAMLPVVDQRMENDGQVSAMRITAQSSAHRSTRHPEARVVLARARLSTQPVDPDSHATTRRSRRPPLERNIPSTSGRSERAQVGRNSSATSGRSARARVERNSPAASVRSPRARVERNALAASVRSPRARVERNSPAASVRSPRARVERNSPAASVRSPRARVERNSPAASVRSPRARVERNSPAASVRPTRARVERDSPAASLRPTRARVERNSPAASGRSARQQVEHDSHATTGLSMRRPVERNSLATAGRSARPPVVRNSQSTAGRSVRPPLERDNHAVSRRSVRPPVECSFQTTSRRSLRPTVVVGRDSGNVASGSNIRSTVPVAEPDEASISSASTPSRPVVATEQPVTSNSAIRPTGVRTQRGTLRRSTRILDVQGPRLPRRSARHASTIIAELYSLGFV